MAGAGGLFVMLVGALLGLGAGGGSIALVLFGARIVQRRWGRALAIGLVVLDALATLLTLPAWIVILSGKGTHGEPVQPGDFPLFVYLLLAFPPAAVAGLVWRLVRRPAPAPS